MSHFGDAIQRLTPKDGVRLAFDEANKRFGLDPTNLSKYRNGQHPAEGFVKVWIPAIGRHCGVDPKPLWGAWHADADSRQATQRRNSMLTTFKQLPSREQQDLLDAMHRIAAGNLPVRADFRLTIEVAPTPLDGWNRVMVRSEWSGDVPADALVAMTATFDELEAAYDDSACIYRELVPGDAASLAEAYERLKLPAPMLRYMRGDTDVRLTARAVGDRPGRHTFDNKPMESGRFHLHAAFPYPADVVCYPVSLNRYSVRGRAYITINLNRLDCRWVETVPYSHHSRAHIEVAYPGDFTRVIEIGSDAGALPQGVGAVFMWSSSPPTNEEKAGGP